jgi:hypothetical protein
MRPTAGAIAVIFLISTALVTGVSAQQRHGGGGGGGGFSAAPHGGGGGGGGGFSAAPPWRRWWWFFCTAPYVPAADFGAPFLSAERAQCSLCGSSHDRAA